MKEYGALVERYRQGKTEEYLCSALLMKREVSKRKLIYFMILCLSNFKIRNNRQYSNFGCPFGERLRNYYLGYHM
jgi:hypothetical protein